MRNQKYSRKFKVSLGNQVTCSSFKETTATDMLALEAAYFFHLH